MYLCHCCGEASQPRQVRKVYTIYREVEAQRYNSERRLEFFKRKEIEREIPICHECWEEIYVKGVSFEQLCKRFAKPKGPQILSAWPETVRS